jgi:hyperosmotically inducible periplasmic protein
MKKTLIATALAAGVSLASSVALADSSTFSGATKDAWITGKIETAFLLNAHLNPFAIETDVDNGIVQLSGIVKDDIDRDLAVEVAKGIDGVVDVKSNLTLDADRAAAARESAAGQRDFGSWVDDATTTAVVKSKLVGNANTSGLKIDVDTSNDVVTLSGRVQSRAESDLAEQLARNTGDVKDVRNNLVVDPS